MADQEQLAILKKGAKAWNQWRTENPNTNIDLSGAYLSGAYLSGAHLSRAHLDGAYLSKADLDGANLSDADLSDADLREADLSGADLSDADLSKANLSEADLSGANLRGADLDGANLSKADLTAANLRGADLRGADLRGADLRGADLSGANLSKADLSEANLSDADLSDADLSEANLTDSIIIDTRFGHVDLNTTLGLESIQHRGPSTIGTDTIAMSKGKLPVKFLRGCGLNNWEIESAKLYNPDLSNEEITNIQYRIYDLRATQALQISPLFISYSHADTDFVDKLDKSLNKKGVRFWRDIHDATAGRLEKQIDRAIRQNPTVLLVLSRNSINSDWVEHEVTLARKLEKEIGRDVLCPIALDDSWKQSSWSQVLMGQVLKYYILDCSRWDENKEFDRIFVKLVDGLNLYYKKDS